MILLIPVIGILCYRLVLSQELRELVAGSALYDSMTGALTAIPSSPLYLLSTGLFGSETSPIADLLITIAIAWFSLRQRTVAEKGVALLLLCSLAVGSSLTLRWSALTCALITRAPLPLRAILAIEVIWMAPPLAPLSFLLVALSTLHDGHLGREPSRESHFWGVMSAIAFVMALHTPLPSFPNLPHYARVVPDDGVPGIFRPQVGPDLPIQVIAQSFPGYFQVASIALMLMLCVFASRRRAERRFEWSPLTVFVFTAAMITALDLMVSTHVASLLPFQGLRRAVPGLILYAPHAILLSCCGIILTQRLSLSPRAMAMVTALTLIVSPFILPITGIANAPWSQLSLEQTVQRSVIARSATPSKRMALPPETVIYSNLGVIDKNLLTDRNPGTRWGAPQKNNPWIEFNFGSSITVGGIFLDIGSFTTDFPRGLHFTNACGAGSVPSEAWEYNLKHWYGPIQRSQDGFPYFGAEQRVHVIFPEPVLLQCLTITATAESNFDWSVAEVRLLR